MGRARDERSTLADLLDEAGPARETLCTGWTTHDLVAHLVTRERVPRAMPGLIVPPLHGLTEAAERSTMRANTFPAMVAMFRAGPPWWHPARIGPVDDLVNFVEFFVHTEDVLRAGAGWKPRDLGEATQSALWRNLKLLGLGGYRKSPVGVAVERTDRPGRARLRRGTPEVVLSGEPAELLLHAFGRGDRARVEISGEDDALVAFGAADVGL